MKAETVAALQDARTKRHPLVLATRLSDAGETLIYADRAEGVLAKDAALLAAAHRALGIGRSETVDLGGEKVFLNVYVPPPRLIIVDEPTAEDAALAKLTQRNEVIFQAMHLRP